MANLPMILIISQGEQTPEDIITNIRKIPIDQDKQEIDHETETYGYKYHLETKYYTTDLLLCPLNKPLNECPLNLLSFIEGLIIYFDANNREFLNELQTYATFLETNQIEFGILLCHELFDDEKEGITYKEAKKHSTLLDVIELGRQRETDDEDDNEHDPIGYDELLQAIKSFIWSNVNVNGEPRVLKGYVNLGSDDVDINEIASEFENELKQSSSNKLSGNNNEELVYEDEEQIESELEGFEKLLNEVMEFKSKTKSWSRDECLNYAHGFAEMFDKLVGDGPPSEDEIDEEAK